MRRLFFVTAIAILGCAADTAWQTANAQEQPGPQQVQLTQEHIQIMQQIVQQMPAEQREALAKLPREQQQEVMLRLLARVLKPQPKKVKELLEEDQDKRVIFEEAERYPDCAERVEDFIYKKTERRVDVTAVAFLHEGHDHFLVYKRLYRVKYKTPKNDKEYMADFLFEKNGPYLKVKEWRRVPEEEQANQEQG